jgi:tetratricopeptide (TPR) repeat protein
LGELLTQSRLVEAADLARAILALDPDATFRGRSLNATAEEIDRTMGGLVARVAVPLPPGAPPAARVERARLLAVLGEGTLALATLESTSGPDADNLRGTIFESGGDWPAAREAFRRAEAALATTPPTPARDAALVRSATGVAYCERKLGRYAEAEAAYRRVLELSPTADSHFLLARFYEDAQQTSLAAEHARHAVELAPDRFSREGGLLLRRLTASHFGCLGVYAGTGR